MQAEYKLTLPWAPSVNTYYRRSGHTIHMSVKGRKFKEAVKAQLIGERLHKEGITERLRIRIELCPPNLRKFDIDNRVKPILDALQAGGLFVDDEQIDHISIKRGAIDGDKQGYCVVQLAEL